MIEIFVILWFSAHLSSVAASKRRGRSWGWLGVGMWFGGEILGVLLARLFITERLWIIYAVGIGVALVAAVIADRWVHGLTVLQVAPEAASAPVWVTQSAAPVSHEPCRQCGKVILVGLDRCPYCLVNRPH